MVQQFAYPSTESELITIQEQFYSLTKHAIEQKEVPRFKGLLEIISSEVTIVTAIHNIKGNKGSNTPGTDGETIQKHILEKSYSRVIKRVKIAFDNYEPQLIRREWINKPGKPEKRPLGIPAAIDRIIQECIRIVIEPILEAQFFNHSYGFRPMRDTWQAMSRVSNIIHDTGYQWIIEGDVTKCFDSFNHRIMLKQLWHMGIRDRRLLMIIKQMLQAGIMDEIEINEFGVQQGGIISPLLANVYLHRFDQWVTREWEKKQTKRKYKTALSKVLKRTKLKPEYLIRYADDWVLITNTRDNALKWKRRITEYLGTNLKLKLSDEKTKITNIIKRPIRFLGFLIKFVPGKASKGYVNRSRPNPDRLTNKVNVIRKNIKQIRHLAGMEAVVAKIGKINTQIRGLIQYYQAATYVNIDLAKQQYRLKKISYNVLKNLGGKLIPANQSANLKNIHSQYTTIIPAIEYNGHDIAITSLAFCSWKKTLSKNQGETPYTAEGREKYSKRAGRSPPLPRKDSFLSRHLAERATQEERQPIYNFEYFMNRAYAFNCDLGKCRICKMVLTPETLEIHHLIPCLPLDKVNKVQNLASVCKECHDLIHSNENCEKLGLKVWKKILLFREKLEMTTDDNDGTRCE